MVNKRKIQDKNNKIQVKTTENEFVDSIKTHYL